MNNSREQLLVVLAFLCIFVVWGTTYIAVSVALRSLPPFLTGSLRFALASTMLYAALRARGPQPLRGLPIGMVIVTGILLCGTGNGFTVVAQQGVPTGIAALLNSTIPIFVALLDWGFFTRRAPNALAGAGLAIGIGGVAVIVTRTDAFAGPTGGGYLLALVIAASTWSLGTLLQRGVVSRDRLLALACGQMIVGAIFQAVVGVADGELPRLHLTGLDASTWAAMFYLAAFGSVLTQSSYLWLLARLPAEKVTTYALINPLVAMLLGASLLGEPLTPATMLGAAMVIGGVALVLFQDRFATAVRRFAALRAD